MPSPRYDRLASSCTRCDRVCFHSLSPFCTTAPTCVALPPRLTCAATRETLPATYDPSTSYAPQLTAWPRSNVHHWGVGLSLCVDIFCPCSFTRLGSCCSCSAIRWSVPIVVYACASAASFCNPPLCVGPLLALVWPFLTGGVPTKLVFSSLDPPCEFFYTVPPLTSALQSMGISYLHTDETVVDLGWKVLGRYNRNGDIPAILRWRLCFSFLPQPVAQSDLKFGNSTLANQGVWRPISPAFGILSARFALVSDEPFVLQEFAVLEVQT